MRRMFVSLRLWGFIGVFGTALSACVVAGSVRDSGFAEDSAAIDSATAPLDGALIDVSYEDANMDAGRDAPDGGSGRVGERRRNAAAWVLADGSGADGRAMCDDRCGGVVAGELRNFCDARCGAITDGDRRNFCRGSCGAIFDGDLRNFCDGRCGAIFDGDLRNLCDGRCGTIFDGNLRNFCQGNCGAIFD